MGIEADLALIAEQENLLRFGTFGAEAGGGVGSHLREGALARGAAMTFEITVGGRVVFC